MLKRLLWFFSLTAACYSQSRVLQLCDSQSPKNCYTWDIGANISTVSPLNITGPILPLNGGTMTGALLSSVSGIAAIDAQNGGIRSQANYFYTNATPTNPSASQGGFEYQGSGVYQFWNGTAWATANLTGSGASVWTRDGSGFLFPTTVTDSVVIGSNTHTNATAKLEISNGGNTGLYVVPTATGQLVGCGPGTDGTCVDYFGFEGNFFRVKTNLDYFDVTGWGTGTSPLGAHTFEIRDSTNNYLIHYTANATAGGSNKATSAGIWTFESNVVIDNNNGLSVNQANDGSGYIGQFNGGIEMTANDATHNILSKGTNTNAIDVSTGGMLAKAVYLVTNTTPTNPPGTQGGLEYQGSGTYQFWNGVAWQTANLAGGSNFWTRNGAGFLFPATNTDKVMINRNTDDGSGAFLQINGPVHTTAGNGLLIGQNNDSSGYLVQVAGGIETTGSNNNIVSSASVRNALYAPNGGVVSGFALGTTDFTVTAGSMLSSAGFLVVSGNTNASISALTQVPGVATFLSSGRSGIGTFLPLEVFVGGGQRMTFFNNGNIAIGGTSDLGNGLLQISGNLSANTINGTNYQLFGIQFMDNGGGSSPRFVGAGGVLSNGSGVFNGDIGTNGKYNQGANNGKGGTVTFCTNVTGGNCVGTAQMTFAGGILVGCAGTFSCF